MENRYKYVNIFTYNMLETVNQRIKHLLYLLNIKQIDFAESLKIQRSTLNGIIKDRQKPSFKAIQAILNAYPNINALWLITGEGEPFNDVKEVKSGNSKNESGEKLNPAWTESRLIEFMDKRINELEREIKELDPETAKKLGIK